MADLTSLYRKNSKRDITIQTCVDCINLISLKYPSEFTSGLFTDYFDITGGTQPPKSKFIYSEKNEYIRFLQIRDFSSDDTLTYIPISKHNKLCNDNDILLGRYGASIGKILTGKSGAYNVACAKISIINPELVNKDFLFYLLHSSKFQSDIKSFSRSAQGGFNKNDLSRINISLPSIKLQNEFTLLLKTIDKSIVSNVNASFDFASKDNIIQDLIKMVNKFLLLINEIELLKQGTEFQHIQIGSLKQAILNEALKGKLAKQLLGDISANELLEKIKGLKNNLNKKAKDFPEIKIEEIPFEIPPNWKWCRLGEVIDFLSGNNFESTDFYKGIGIKCIKITNAGVKEIVETDDVLPLSFLEKYKQFVVYEGDLVLALTRPFISTGLKISICPASYNNSLLNQRVAVIRPLNGIVKEYIYLFLSSNLVLSKYKQMFKGQGQQPNLKKEDVTNLLLPLPPEEEQFRIVTEVEKQLSKINKIENYIQNNQELIEQLQNALLKSAFENYEK